MDIVFHYTTNLPACSLNAAERTESSVLHTLWLYVLATDGKLNIIYFY